MRQRKRDSAYFRFEVNVRNRGGRGTDILVIGWNFKGDGGRERERERGSNYLTGRERTTEDSVLFFYIISLFFSLKFFLVYLVIFMSPPLL